MLFRCAKETLLEVAADPRYLGARIGLLAVLHTWNQRLTEHPHLHWIVPGSGLSMSRRRWIACRNPEFFLPVRYTHRVAISNHDLALNRPSKTIPSLPKAG